MRSVIFKGWKWYEFLYLAVMLGAVTVCFFTFSRDAWLSYITSVAGIVAILCVSKGVFYAPILNMIYAVLYFIVSFNQRYFGEVITCVMMIPVYILSIVSWVKNRNKVDRERVNVNEIGKKEYIILFSLVPLLVVAIYFLLKAFDTSQLIISTMSLSVSVVAGYLLLRRCKFYALFYLVNDVIIITLWSISVYSSGLSYLPILLCNISLFMSDCYGLIVWIKRSKVQKQQKNDSI